MLNRMNWIAWLVATAIVLLWWVPPSLVKAGSVVVPKVPPIVTIVLPPRDVPSDHGHQTREPPQ